jgi:virulence-associated protein VapD
LIVLEEVSGMEVLDRLLAEIQPKSGLGTLPLGSVRLYAIAFDLDTKVLETVFGEQSYQTGYRLVRRILEDEGFTGVQGSVYFGKKGTDPVTCVLLVQRMARELPWFGDAVRDIRMLRIEEDNDLKPAIPQPVLPLS